MFCKSMPLEKGFLNKDPPLTPLKNVKVLINVDHIEILMPFLLRRELKVRTGAVPPGGSRSSLVSFRH